jgi:hypothetical protein
MLKVLLSFVAASVAAIAGLVLAVAALFQDIVVHMSLLALTLSILSAFKEDIFPFRPIVPLKEIIMAPPSGPSHNSIAPILPLKFINKGHGGRDKHARSSS